jgi:glucose/arabinose dehydrogenase/PKD repeat protein
MSAPPRSLLWVIGCLASLLTLATAPAGAASLPAGFQDETVFAGLSEPTAIRFAPDGHVFVALKEGKILDYDSTADESPTVFVDLRKQVYDNGDRGILGLALDPEFPVKPYVYVLYTFDHVLGEDAPGAYPRWGQPPTYSGDPCPKPESADVDACPVSGRLVRLIADAGDEHAVAEKVLIENWCQQDSSHSIGDLEFGPEGALFASGGEGASFISSDYGQYGWPHKNQCGDPPGSVGEALKPPHAEGGSLRSQDVRTPENPLFHTDPTTLDGAVIRIDPASGEGFPGNPMASSSDPNARRIIAYGFRNPFRFAIDRESDEVYVGNVGNGTYEEIDRFSTEPGKAYDSGWPCYEGDEPNWGFYGFELDACESLYEEEGSTSQPFFFYDHSEGVTPEDPCPSYNGSAISGSSFYTGAAFPASYEDALFFADPVRGCMYVMFPGDDGRPDPSTVTPFLSDAGLYPGVDIQEGPEGDLYYVSLFGDEYGPGSIHRISYSSGNQPPVAHLTATPEWGSSPLTATFDATGSTDADGEALNYEWDPEGDGSYEKATSGGAKSRTFKDATNHTVAVRVRDGQGATSIARVTVYPGDTPPQPQIVAPALGFTWRVGEPIEFEGLAHDGEDGDLAGTSLDWNSRLYHCPSSGCHAHPLQAFPAVAAGTLIAPDHDYPSHIDLTLTAVDSRGLSARKTISLYPRTVDLDIASEPAGVTLTAGLLTQPGPFSFTAIEGSHITLSAPLSTEFEGEAYAWQGWSDGGDRAHSIEVDGSVTEYLASYSPGEPPPEEEPPGEEEPPEEESGEEEGPLGEGGAGEAGQVSPPSAVASPQADKATTGAPQTSIGAHPRRRVVRSTARFAFSSSAADSRFRCKLDGRPFRACASPWAYRRLQPGWHAFRVFAIAPDGSFDPTPAGFKWWIQGPG